MKNSQSLIPLAPGTAVSVLNSIRIPGLFPTAEIVTSRSICTVASSTGLPGIQDFKATSFRTDNFTRGNPPSFLLMNGRIMTIDIVTAEEADPEGRGHSEPFIAAGVKAQARSGL